MSTVTIPTICRNSIGIKDGKFTLYRGALYIKELSHQEVIDHLLEMENVKKRMERDENTRRH